MKNRGRSVPQEPRWDHTGESRSHDPYAVDAKTKESTICEGCGAVYHGGRWSWKGPPLGNDHSGLCPACRRIRDRYPAGTIRIHGHLGKERDEILNMIKNVEEAEKADHPLERLMEMKDEEDGLLVTTTGLHLARRVASALKRRFHGGVEIQYSGVDENLIRVTIEREGKSG